MIVRVGPPRFDGCRQVTIALPLPGTACRFWGGEETVSISTDGAAVVLLPLVSSVVGSGSETANPCATLNGPLRSLESAWACSTTVAETPGASVPTSMPAVSLYVVKVSVGPHATVFVTRHQSALPRCDDSELNLSVE